jgi:hypothetical protein
MLLGIIDNDRPIFQRIDDYVEGKHDGPYIPHDADDEYRLLAERSVSNWIPLLLNSPCQACYVDSFRRGAVADHEEVDPPEWKHWQESRLDAKQIQIHRGALKYGHSFTLTEKKLDGKVITTGLSAFYTAAVYRDAANDIEPYAALNVWKEPDPAAKRASDQLGRARMWDSEYVYEITFRAYKDEKSVRVHRGVKHGSSQCPVTRFAAKVDLEGRTIGVVWPNINVQNRINQSVFDLLVTQSYGAFFVRTARGMSPPMQRWTQSAIDKAGTEGLLIRPGVRMSAVGVEPGDPMVDPETGEPIPKRLRINASRFLFAEDPEAEFGSLPPTTLDGYIKSLDMSIRHLAAMTQTPPHYLLGEIANLSAEALQAAETALLRSVEEYKKSFGESWERVFRLAAELSGDTAAALDQSGEVIWRNMEMRSLAADSDGLLKLREMGVPMRGLFARVPQATRNEIKSWMLMLKEDGMESPEAIANSIISLVTRLQSVLPEGTFGPKTTGASE